MKQHVYCIGHCNREQRRACKQDCGRGVSDNPVDQALIDIETFYLTVSKQLDSNPFFDWVSFKFAVEGEDEELTHGFQLVLLWTYAVGREPDSWSWKNHPAFWNPWWKLPQYFQDNWKDDRSWYAATRDEAIANGLDSTLEAFYAGVPYDDLVA